MLTYQLARTYLLQHRERSVLRQAYANGYLVREVLVTPSADVARLLASLETSGSSHALLHRNGQWFGASVEVGRDALPERLRSEVLGGTPARQRFALRGEPKLAVGLPLPAVEAAYFEVFPLDDLHRTLRILASTLTAGAVVTSLAGAALGLVTSRRVLQPVAAVSRAASAVASGDFEARVEASGDRDLASLARSFNTMTDYLCERIERESRFASAVSHELRSPLTTLVASLEVLRARRGELSERGRSALDLLTGETRRFQRLVEDLLEISRLDAGVADVVWEEIRLGPFLTNALAPFGDIPLTLDNAADTVVRADKRRLERVVANLVTNANTYGGGVVKVSVEQAKGSVRLAVEDAGPGVAPEERERIFERFIRGRSATGRGTGEGSGLGLALVTEHVRLHGGKVWVEDRDGAGARFVVELPLPEP